jgi:hypothetical protein
MVSDYIPGTRLSTWMTERGCVPLATGTVLHIVHQVAQALRALADHEPDLFHGAVGLDRVVLASDGRVLLVEAGLGSLLAAQPERSPDEWWSEYRLAVPFAADAVPFGAATDACQLGVLALELLLGRRLRPAEYPNGLALLLGTAEETDLVGTRSPLGAALFEWLSLTLGLDGGRDAPAIDVVGDALEQLLSDEGGYVAVPLSVDIPPEPLEVWPLTPDATLEPAGPQGLPVSSSWGQIAPRAAGRSPEPPPALWPRTREGLVTDAPRDSATFDLSPTSRIDSPQVSGSDLQHTSSFNLQQASRPPEQRSRRQDGSELLEFLSQFENPGATVQPAASEAGARPTRARVGLVTTSPVRLVEDPGTAGRGGWRTTLRWGMVAVALTVTAALGTAGWRYWRERHIGQQTGTITVESQPSGATILIDGIERGKSPFSLALPPGRHEFLAKSAQGMGQATLQVNVGGRHRVLVPLQLGTDPGYIDISSDPPGAQVSLDGAPAGRSPVSLSEIPPGEHVLVVTHGSARLERKLMLAPAERLTIYVPLAGWVTVRSRVPVDVLDRGQMVGSSTAGRLLVPAGRRRLQFVNDDFGVNTMQDVIVQAGQVADVTVPLAAGVLSVSADLQAEVWVDGEPVGRTPTGNLSVAIGEHEVLVAHPQWGEQRLTVIVGLGAPTRLSIKLAGATGSRPGAQRVSPKRSGISAAR